MFRRVVCSARPLLALRPAATVTAVATRPAAAAALHCAAPRRSDDQGSERSSSSSGSGDRNSGDRDSERRGRRGSDRDRDGGHSSGDRFRRGGGARGLKGGSGKSLRVQLAEEAAAEQLLVPSNPVTGVDRGRLSKFADLHAIASGMAKNKEKFERTVNARPGEQAEDADGDDQVSDFLLDSQTPPPPSNKKIASQTVYTNAEIPNIEFKAPVHPNSRVAVHGIGVPAVHVVQHQRPRRYFKPQSVQNVPKPMKTYTEGPREMGNKIVRTFIGHVVSDKMQKTVAVEVSQYYRHPKYHKYIKTSKKFLTHDEEEECNIGDVVEIRVCRPLSKRKRFTLHRILKPKLLIEEGARRFEEHQPEWKKSPEQIAFEQQQQAEKETATASS